MAYELIETIELGSSAVTIEFLAIASDATDLLLVTSLRTDNDPDGFDYGVANVQFNGSVANYSSIRLLGTGDAVDSTSAANFTFVVNGSGSTANTFSNDQFYISNYTSSAAKSVSTEQVWENNLTRADAAIRAMLWDNTAAISSIAVNALSSGNFVAGSLASLYKIS